MSDAATPFVIPIDPLNMIERRILGVLIEKQKTSKSADAYPMTLNSLTLGCNQKSNRDPVLELSDDDVEETLVTLGRKGLTMKMTGSRVDRYRHLLYDVWKVAKVEMAILAELMMRGPQSFGELRTRASRMDEIADLETLTQVLKSLAERKFVVFLTDPDRRGAMVTHGFHSSEELPAIKDFAAGVSTAAFDHHSSKTPMSMPSNDRIAMMEKEFGELKTQIADLQNRIARLELFEATCRAAASPETERIPSPQ